ncbi:hypothetical protein MN608_05496 [Microdochium nivale]|nr:hypothetical protein MN608_05496 [Microdochium nivale]
MGRYYRQASLSIFALGSSGDEEGCFRPRDGDRTTLHRTPMFDELVSIMRQTSMSPTFIQRNSRHKFPYALDDVVHEFENISKVERDHPLQWRGWTLQEWVLSNRALGFGAEEANWVCPTMSACECLPEGSPDVPRSTVGPSYPGPARERGLLLDDIPDLVLADLWFQVAREFSRRSLTYADDKLPALAGLASEFSKAKVGRYVAGLWNDDNLRYQLAWAVFPTWETTRPSGYRAPTWSWASIDGKTRVPPLRAVEAPSTDYHTRGVALLCAVLDCWTVPLTPLNPLGPVVGGSLTLRGRFRRAKVQPNNGRSKFDKVLIACDEDTGNELAAIYPDDTTLVPTFQHIWCMPLVQCSREGFRCIGLVEVEKEEVDGAAHYGKLCSRVLKRVAMVKTNDEIALKSGSHVQNYTEEVGFVHYEPNDTLTTAESILSWLEQASEVEISVV